MTAEPPFRQTLLDRGGRLLRLAGAAFAEPLDQVRDVRELLLEVALVVLEPLEDVVAVVPSSAEAAVVSSASVHVHLPSYRSRNVSIRVRDRRSAPALFAEASRVAIAGSGYDAHAVTHVVTVSCTGMFAPGPDYHLVRDLDLSPTVERYHLGFIGCAAAIPALRLAARIVGADPAAVVLVACAAVDGVLWRKEFTPAWYFALRCLLTSVASLSLLAAAPSMNG